MEVYKFGGASVKDAEAVKNLGDIVKNCKSEGLVVVVSAMGKMTNALEEIVDAYYYSKENLIELVDGVREYHLDIIKRLFITELNLYNVIYRLFDDMKSIFKKKPSLNYDFEYDRIVSYGEIVSTKIICSYLNYIGVESEWVDSRNCIRTDSVYRDANVEWKLTEKIIKETITNDKIYITQGFISSTTANIPTTLGREGSDYSAAIFASCLSAEKLSIWKDVDGLYNADPKMFEDAIILDEISYREAIELAFYGAKVIHPKTIKPLENKNIPLYVKSFINPDKKGSLISTSGKNDKDTPSYIIKENQVLISFAPRNYSFIVEKNISKILSVFADLNISVNMMENSALKFSACIDYRTDKLQQIIEALKDEYSVLYNTGLELYTIRHYKSGKIEDFMDGKTILLEGKSRDMSRFVVKR